MVGRKAKKQKRRRRLDIGRLVARLLCGLFALIGCLPLGGGLLVGSEPVQAWAAAETGRVLQEQLGLAARYRVRMQLWPLQVAMEDLEVPASDAGTPALTARRLSIRPRIFSLLAGRLDVGDIELDAPRGRFVVRDGRITNVAYRLPERREQQAGLARAPFASLAVTDAVVALDVDGVLVEAGPLDLDVFADWGPSFEIALRVAETTLERSRSTAAAPTSKPDEAQQENGKTGKASTPTVAVDEDILCALDLRARVDPDSVLVRRLSLLGLIDMDTRRGTRPSCAGVDAAKDDDPAQVALRLSQLRLQRREGLPPVVSGHVVVRTPLALANRFVEMAPLKGWVGVVADVRHDGSQPLPQLNGKVRGGGIQLERYHLAKTLKTDVDLADGLIRLPRFEAEIADGKAIATGVRIRPLAPGVPFHVDHLDCLEIQFPGLMRDLGVTENTIVAWDIERAEVTELKGTLDPLKIDGDLLAQPRDFEVFDRSVHDTGRRHMIGVASASIRGRIGARPDALLFYDTRVAFGKSSLFARLVSIGFTNLIHLDVEESTVDLADISPLVQIPWTGRAKLSATMAGDMSDPLLTGKVAIDDFVFGGFPVGNVRTERVRFRPLELEVADVQARKGRSDYSVPTARLDFDSQADLVLDAAVRSDRLDLRDFFAMWHFDQDPRFAQIHGTCAVNAQVRFDLGGPRDRCGGGRLEVRGDVDVQSADVYEERYGAGHAEFDFRWLDRDASYLGFELDVPSATIKKGSGTLLGSLSMRQGARLSGQVVATGIPVEEIQALGALGKMLDAQANGVAEVSGTVDAMAVGTHVTITPTRVGGSTLPASQLYVELEPKPREPKTVGTTRCGQPIPAPFDRAEYDQDRVAGVFHISGGLFGEQVRLNDLQVTRQRAKNVQGEIELSDLDLGAIAELGGDLLGPRPDGRLSAKVRIEDLALQQPYAARANVTVSGFSVRRDGLRVQLLPGARTIVMQEHSLQVPALALAVTTERGPEGVVDAQATVTRLGQGAELDGSLRLRPVDLSALAGLIPRVQRASGELRGDLHVSGPVRSLNYSGAVAVEASNLTVRGLTAPVTDLQLELGIGGNEVRVRRGSARIGNGTIEVTGAAPLRNWRLGAARGVITVRSLTFSPTDGVNTRSDADLVATWDPYARDAQGRSLLPRLTGDVTLRSFEYTRPITMSADINTLTQRGKRTEFEAYDPADDSVEFDLTMKSSQPLLIKNNFVNAKLDIAREGLKLAGTNQRFGLRGTVQVRPGGDFRLRRNEFEIQQGQVRFDDLTRIAPQVDVTAVTEYRRYSETLGDSGGQDAAGSGTLTAAAGGQWNIVMHAYGDAEKLRVDLTSQPALSQDDIFLLLTVGLTRAELDQARSASVGESVALEALGTLSGADKAVTEVVPVIDDFRFGSAYSSRTGRTEPTVTIGKRLADRIRANVTSGLTDSREVRSNVEWRLSRRVSVEGSYDNVNDISSSSLGNLGADIRWRLEFR